MAEALLDPRISNDSNQSIHVPPSKQHSRFAYIILLWLGIANMLPWNAFITAQSYYESRFCGSMVSSTFMNYMVLCFEVGQPFGLMLSLFYGHYISSQDQVRYPLIIYTIVFMIITITAGIDINAIPMFYLTLLFTFLCGFSSALMNGGLYGLSGILPPIFTSAIMMGSSLSGLVVSISSLITEAASISISDCSTNTDGSYDDDDNYHDCDDDFTVDYGSISYFIITTMVIIICIILFEIFIRTNFLRYYMMMLLQRYDYDNPDLALISLSLSYKRSLSKNINDRASILALSYHSRSNIISSSNIIKSLQHHASDGYHDHRINNSYSHSDMQSSSHKSWNTTSDIDHQHHQPAASYPISKSSYTINPLAQPLLSPVSSSQANPLHPTSSHSDELQSVILGSTAHDHHKTVIPSPAVDHHQLRSTDPLSHDTSTMMIPTSPMPINHVNLHDIYHVLYIIRIPAFSVFISFVISLAIFPSLIVSIESQYDCPSSYGAQVFNKLWIPIIFVSWNIFDFVGRYAAELTKHLGYIHAKNIWMVALSRAIILILMLFCNIKDSRLPKVFINDILTLFFVSIFGLTSGYVANLSMMLGPELVSLEKSSLAGTIMVVALTLGLLVGSMLSFVVVYGVRGNVFG